ncbi:putative mucin/carbohydrate-binding domain-containing protein [Clostridium tarantellae]|uniref:putative mucin/carbohydrate-binding domain-containing protein n=1 Tax=Clostridium tarantellae TaxID=39493 RepID=UPI00147830AE|nr:putative mucin/carbohydrate-binding domain-containing protein [Clostridium tarantellae]
MYCNCSNKENYEVIALCDIKKFADKNGPFNNKAWVQISVSDLLMLDCNKLAIEKIEKIYINVSIANTKIIETPVSSNPNSEGMTLTGKKLLIDGFICSKIVYTSLTKEQSVYTSKFTVPFCTYIVIEPNADVFNDKYCIKTCIEDVFLSLADCKTIFQNVTLFLVAEKVSITCPSVQPAKEDCTIINVIPPVPPDPEPDSCEEPQIPEGETASIINVVRVKDSNVRNTISEIYFHTNTKQIKVTSNSNLSTSDNTYPNNAYFLFKLRDCNNNIKKKALIKSKEDASNFKMALENTDFKYGDFIEVELLLGRTAEIADFPSSPQIEILGRTAEIGDLIKNFYKINYNGLTAYTPNPPITFPILPNVININSVNNSNNPIISMVFNKEDKMIITTFRNESADRSNDYTYASFKLSKPNGTVVAEVDFNSRQSPAGYIDSLIKLLFEYNDIIELTYSPQAMTNVNITHFPSANQNHTPTTNTEKYKITPTGLVLINTPTIIDTLPNTITLNAADNTPVLNIQFDTTNDKVKVNSTGKTTDSTGGTDYFSFTLYESDGKTEKITDTIGGNMNGMDFSNKVSNTSFQNGDIVVLAYEASDKVIITNYPDSNTPTYTPKGNEESFQITQTGLVKYTPVTPPIPDLLKSQEINFDNVATITFDVDAKQLKVTSTGNIEAPRFNNAKYFLFKLRDSSNNIKKYSSIKAYENANSFASELNNSPFVFRDIIELTCFTNTKIEIKNFPTTGQNTFIDGKSFNSEVVQGFFRITANGLQDYTPSVAPATATLPNTIKINTITNDDFLAINFNTLDKVFQTFSFARAADTSNEYNYVIAKLYDTNNNLIITSTIPSNNSTASVETGLSSRIFDYNYILDLTYAYKARPNILVTNLNGTDYVPEHFNERYKITTTGLELIPMFLPNLITIKGVNDNSVAFIEFNALENTLKGTATSNMADSSNDYDYVIVKLHALIDPTLTNPLITATLKSNAVSTTFANTINRGYFKEGFILQIVCNDKALNKVTISNFGSLGQLYTITKSIEYFKITNNGLVLFTPTSMLKNNVISTRDGRFVNSLKDILTISFDSDSFKIKASTTGEAIGRLNINWSERIAFSYKFKDSNGVVIKEDSVYAYDSGTLNRDGNATSLVNGLNGTHFAYGQSLELYSPANDYNTIKKVRLHISNFPFNSNEYWKVNDTETVTITPLGLVLSSSPLANIQFLENVIQVKDKSSGDFITQIYFDISSNKLIATSSTTKVNFNSSAPSHDYFVFILKDSSGNEKSVARLKENEYVNNFLNALNTVSFNIGDRIELYCINYSSKVSISNLPKFGEEYKLLKNGEEFIITKLGLITLIKILKNKITFLGLGNDLIATVNFDTNLKELIVNSTGTQAHSFFGNREYFAVVLKDDSGTTIKEASVKGNENANAFATTLNDTSFQYGYTITVRFAEKGRFLVSNYPNDGDTYKSSDGNPKTFIINNLGLVLKKNTLKNTINFNGFGDRPIAAINFDEFSNTLIVTSTGNVAHSNFGDRKYFTVVLKDNSSTTIKEASVKGNGNANDFAATLNNTSFQNGYTITISFIEKDRFLVSNYPNDGDTYESPDDNPKTFTITLNGLVLQ